MHDFPMSHCLTSFNLFEEGHESGGGIWWVQLAVSGLDLWSSVLGQTAFSKVNLHFYFRFSQSVQRVVQFAPWPS